ncbi:3-isopropylmalate dehydrogenase [PVC group bacterium (ex Bugula neritina AB1)]|nr:3-isopropylmalate dehydrogenase [PVC group bacterium (ex Bugula neritina AB1)]
MYKIAVIPGDGIGSEVMQVGLGVLESVCKKHQIEYEAVDFLLGAEHYLETGEALSDETLEKLKSFDTILLGAIGSPKVAPGILEKGILLKLRFALDQYINLRPVRLYPGVESPLKEKVANDLDYVVVRENTGGLYTGIGGRSMVGSINEVASQSMVYNYAQVERCLRYAFELAQTRERKKLALIGKSNVLTHVFDLWLRVFDEIRQSFPDVKTEYYHVDAACMHMVRSPEMFDVMVTTNMFGDIITDLGAETQGGMGMACSGNLNPTKTTPSMFEPVHGSAPDITGQNKANPLAMVMSVKMMLEFLNENEAAKSIDQAIVDVSQKSFHKMSTDEIANALMASLQK